MTHINTYRRALRQAGSGPWHAVLMTEGVALERAKAWRIVQEQQDMEATLRENEDEDIYATDLVSREDTKATNHKTDGK